MVFTLNRIESHKDVPIEWIYQHYLSIPHALDGQLVKIRSFVNSDTTPSLCLYPKNGVYKWKDFSSGIGGSAIDLVMELSHLKGTTISYTDACRQVVDEYNTYVRRNGKFIPSVVEPELSDYSLSADFEIGDWGEPEDLFWYCRYGVKEMHTNYYNIYPLKWYQLSKNYAGHKKTFKKVEGDHIYGYFTDKGELYQIYQPYNKDMKFIKLKYYVQGLDQLGNSDYEVCIIGSSLKDIAAATALNLEVEYIAPPSETTLLPKDLIDRLKKEYKYVFTLFDNDTAGIKAMKRYEQVHGLPYIYIPYEKDISDYVEKSGQFDVKWQLTTRINKKINE